MATRDLASRLRRRAGRAGVELDLGVMPKIEGYLLLLARWNRRINLTSLPLEPPSDAAIDRLIVEPLAAAKLVGTEERLCVDVGSGGGSPGIPLHLAVPALRIVLVESKVRKSAFLREVVRQLELGGVEIENRRVEELLGRADLLESADLVTLRAVRADARLWNTVQGFLRPGGRVFWFGSHQYRANLLPPLSEVGQYALVPALGSDMRVLLKTGLATADRPRKKAGS